MIIQTFYYTKHFMLITGQEATAAPSLHSYTDIKTLRTFGAQYVLFHSHPFGQTTRSYILTFLQHFYGHKEISKKIASLRRG